MHACLMSLSFAPCPLVETPDLQKGPPPKEDGDKDRQLCMCAHTIKYTAMSIALLAASLQQLSQHPVGA